MGGGKPYSESRISKPGKVFVWPLTTVMPCIPIILFRNSFQDHAIEIA